MHMHIKFGQGTYMRKSPDRLYQSFHTDFFIKHYDYNFYFDDILDWAQSVMPHYRKIKIENNGPLDQGVCYSLYWAFPNLEWTKFSALKKINNIFPNLTHDIFICYMGPGNDSTIHRDKTRIIGLNMPLNENTKKMPINFYDDNKNKIATYEFKSTHLFNSSIFHDGVNNTDDDMYLLGYEFKQSVTPKLAITLLDNFLNKPL